MIFIPIALNFKCLELFALLLSSFHTNSCSIILKSKTLRRYAHVHCCRNEHVRNTDPPHMICPVDSGYKYLELPHSCCILCTHIRALLSWTRNWRRSRAMPGVATRKMKKYTATSEFVSAVRTEWVQKSVIDKPMCQKKLIASRKSWMLTSSFQ